ncbi:histone deacetylation protein Rxt3-domain-containing protein, partial [Elsinoe ampelina]
HHHHHHHAHPPHTTHHHHHTKPAAPVPAPKIHVKSQEVFDMALTKPRVHLGSALYSPNLTLSSNKPRPLEEMKRFFAAAPGPIPYFPEKENGSFTIRVPRSYLASSYAESVPVAGGLEEICDRRALWGTEIYTDDSDVVAAAVHSGWIKGDFGAYSDDLRALEAQTEMNGTNGDKTNGDTPHSNETPDKLDTKPVHPVFIPADRDMHITVVILPPLSKYEGSVLHHLKSRTWGGDHDGMSFIIQRIEFVDEGRETRYVERGMGARKRKV